MAPKVIAYVWSRLHQLVQFVFDEWPWPNVYSYLGVAEEIGGLFEPFARARPGFPAMHLCRFQPQARRCAL